ncbi:hypothetical protein [Actinospongicola halichondriae]|uniref:hypothetical protein n=1 Tax=Actinospongicola halichondriae TaxID=3236844 RepID=UPI003D414842
MSGVEHREEQRSQRVPSPSLLAALAGLLYLPFIGFGYGTDIDITNIRRSGRSIFEGEYRYSRPPGAFAHELTTGVLDRIGGSALVALGSVAAAVVALVALARIIERNHGQRAARIAVVVVATQPWFWVTATSLGDYVYALAFLLLGIESAQRDARVMAGLAFALAIGFRSGTGLLIAAYLLAEVTGSDAAGRPASERWRPALTTAVVAGTVGLAFSIPPWLSVGRTTRFLQNQFQTGDLGVMIARWGVKNVAFFGLITIVVVVARAPVFVASLRRFSSLVMVRFAVYAAVATELVYLRFPWKPVHLLPMVLCLAVLLAVSPTATNRLVGAVVASQLLLAVVSVSLAEPDVADAATTGRFAPGLTRGVVVNELDCRLDPDHDGVWPDLESVDADYAAVAVFACQARSWRAGEGPSEPRLPGEPEV